VENYTIENEKTKEKPEFAQDNVYQNLKSDRVVPAIQHGSKSPVGSKLSKKTNDLNRQSLREEAIKELSKKKSPRVRPSSKIMKRDSSLNMNLDSHRRAISKVNR